MQLGDLPFNLASSNISEVTVGYDFVDDWGMSILLLWPAQCSIGTLSPTLSQVELSKESTSESHTMMAGTL
ncbi:hypothetical protein PsorP6_005427 [Peronosclerospora sorghi]|uniref:Uncharacterized protein n=1 Tax=Peronosclerospora sorghi TaxID=230839 RepID=A0ACC0W6C5_9STRA|nr:hypothetical protein PsorP6_005427 [Peronosclerospora sorghi]